MVVSSVESVLGFAVGLCSKWANDDGWGLDLGRFDVGSLLIKVSFEHSGGWWWVLSDLSKCEGWATCHVSCIDGITPGGQGW
jgi:hypothetical protein